MICNVYGIYYYVICLCVIEGKFELVGIRNFFCGTYGYLTTWSKGQIIDYNISNYPSYFFLVTIRFSPIFVRVGHISLLCWIFSINYVMDIQKEKMYYNLGCIPVDRLFTRHSVITSILSSFLFEKRNHFKMYLNVLSRWIFLVNLKNS